MRLDSMEPLEDWFAALGDRRTQLSPRFYERLFATAPQLHSMFPDDMEHQAMKLADSDDVRKLAKSLGVNPDDFKAMGLLNKEKALFILRAPHETDMRMVSRRLSGDVIARGRGAREADAWEERVFPNFMGAAVWNALALMSGTADGPRGTDALRRWLRESGYGSQPEFLGAYAVTLHLLERVFERRREGDQWAEARSQARRGWDLLLKTWKA